MRMRMASKKEEKSTIGIAQAILLFVLAVPAFALWLAILH